MDDINNDKRNQIFFYNNSYERVLANITNDKRGSPQTVIEFCHQQQWQQQ